MDAPLMKLHMAHRVLEQPPGAQVWQRVQESVVKALESWRQWAEQHSPFGAVWPKLSASARPFASLFATQNATTARSADVHACSWLQKREWCIRGKSQKQAMKIDEDFAQQQGFK
ncbi:unnamed protein product [Effrenium voratum]|uniref:Uncharacterized protein n=1 Tax=Effrenium voratum TaxID=2562239 RepID=A0AA36N5R3_9DINO|nr:unnamed protein product [Effrenium voratum]CAJ1455935.1 unnamed protein product [Effrenium voratum]